jgi:hypothetical protein
VRVPAADPSPVRGDTEQVLGDDKAEQLNVGQGRRPPRTGPPGKPQRGEDPIVQMDAQCVQDGVWICLHEQGLTPSAFDYQSSTRSTSDPTNQVPFKSTDWDSLSSTRDFGQHVTTMPLDDGGSIVLSRFSIGRLLLVGRRRSYSEYIPDSEAAGFPCSLWSAGRTHIHSTTDQIVICVNHLDEE